MEQGVTKAIEAGCSDLSEQVENYLKRNNLRRKPSHKERDQLQNSVRLLVTDALISHSTHPNAPVSISLRSNTYSSTHIEYRGIPYRMHVKYVYPALKSLGYLQLLKKGYLDRVQGKGKREIYAATDKLIDFFKFDEPLDVAFSNDTLANRLMVSNQSVPVSPPVVTSIKKDLIKDVHIPPKTKAYKDIKNRVDRLNEYLKRHWIDLKLTPEQWDEMSRGWKDKNGDYHTLNLTKRSLYRVFHDDKLKTGGRFYGGWWQEIPSKFRQNIIVDGKETVECDFSGLHPSILYAKEKQTIPVDPYGPIAGPQNRNIIKRCFNAMLNSKSRTTRAPKEIDIRPTGMKWSEIVEQVELFHAPIKHHFFTSAGMWLMREDSELAEKIMMEYFEYDQFCLPVHDSFIVHHAWEQDLQDKMTAVFCAKYDVKPEIKVNAKLTGNHKEPSTLSRATHWSHEQIFDATNQPHIIRTELFKACNSSG